MLSCGYDAVDGPSHPSKLHLGPVCKPDVCAEDEQPVSKKAKLSQTTKPSAIVLDIEGTITPISFVTDTLFPYAREHLEEHLQNTFESEETQADIALLQDEVRA